MIDLLLAFRILLSATAMHFFYRTWKLCKHKGLLFLAAQPCGAVSIQILLGFEVITPGEWFYDVLLIFVCAFGAIGSYLIYSEFHKAYQEGRYAAEKAP